MTSASFFLPSGTRRIASFSSSPDAGSSSAVQATLNAVCAIAMPYIVALSPSIAGAATARTMQNTASHTTVPMTLNDRWTIAARFALRLVPTEEISAVTQVPMFWPMMMGMAAA